MLQGRHDTFPKRRGLTRVSELKEAGVTIGFGSDCMMDPWYSLGKADMLEVAAMGLHVGQLSSRAEMKWCFDAVTVNSAKIMGFEHYELQKNGRANMVLLQARNKIEAVRLKANRLLVIRDGKLIAQNDPVTTKLFMGGRPNLLNPADYETS